MRVICNKTKARMSPPDQPMAPYEKEWEFDVTISKEYVVFAIAVWKSVIFFLLNDDHDLPNWHPVELFSVSNAQLPENWFFSLTLANEHGVQAIWGYEALISDPSHYEALLEREPNALRIFYQEKARRSADRPGVSSS